MSSCHHCNALTLPPTIQSCTCLFESHLVAILMLDRNGAKCMHLEFLIWTGNESGENSYTPLLNDEALINVNFLGITFDIESIVQCFEGSEKIIVPGYHSCINFTLFNVYLFILLFRWRTSNILTIIAIVD